MTTICADAQLLTDAARVLAARRALEPLLERFARAPLDSSAAHDLRAWLDDSYPPAAAALDRLRASAAAAPHPPSPLHARLRLVHGRGRPQGAGEGQPGRPQRQGRHR